MGPWVIFAAAGLIAIVLGYVGWRITTSTEPDAGPRMQVHPGMYDLRSEARTHAATQASASAPMGQ